MTEALVRELLSRRAILITGKGGVGKTTITAGLARAGVELGKRVLATEVSYEPDATSPLGEALGGHELGEEPVRISERLHGALLTPHAGHLQFLRDSLPVRMLADAALKSAAIRRFLLAAPTLPEMGILYRILDLLRQKQSDGSPKWDVLLVDLPATGHALGLAQIPGAIVDVIRSGPIHTAVSDGLTVLRDPKQTTSIVVTLPETLPVSEAIELARGITTHHVPLHGVVLNRVPPDPFTEAERAALAALRLDEMRMLGARRVPRIERARAARVRLDELGLPVHSVPELGIVKDVPAAVARALRGQGVT
jgi:anion-transporting  ArsA/GET3 family ATPase